jgi:3-methyladenine DNA glycosylase Mpg
MSGLCRVLVAASLLVALLGAAAVRAQDEADTALVETRAWGCCRSVGQHSATGMAVRDNAAVAAIVMC